MAQVSDTTLEAAAEAGFRAALRAGLPEVDARDLAQEALLRALTSAPPPAGVALPAWTYGIARNLARDHGKSAQRREVATEMIEAATTDDDPATVLAVRRAIEELPEPLRDVVTLHELEEHSLAETARALQIPFDTAKDRLRRAREQLRARLGDPDSAVARERSHSRRRAAGQGAAIVAAVYASIGQRALAAGFGANAAASSATAGSNSATAHDANGPTASRAAAAKTSGFAVRGWIAGTVATAMLAGGFVVGRMTAPEQPKTSTAIVDVREQDEPAPQRTQLSATEPSQAPDSPPSTQPAPTVTGERLPNPRTDASAPATPMVASTSDPALDPTQAERLLLDRARAGLQRGMPDEALVTLMSHERQFPTGKLAEERDVMMIEAYVRAGNAALAKKRIDMYRAAHPDGVLRARVDALADRP